YAEFHRAPQDGLGLFPIRRLTPDALAGDPHRTETQPVYRTVVPEPERPAGTCRQFCLGHVNLPVITRALPVPHGSQPPRPRPPQGFGENHKHATRVHTHFRAITS